MNDASDTVLPARAFQESVLAGLLGERHQVAPPDVSGLTGPERRRVLGEWANALPPSVPEGIVKLHHTAQTSSEVRRRFDKVAAREALRDLKAAGAQQTEE